MLRGYQLSKADRDALTAVMYENKITFDDLAKSANLTKTTVQKALDGQRIDSVSLARIFQALDFIPEDYAKSNEFEKSSVFTNALLAGLEKQAPPELILVQATQELSEARPENVQAIASAQLKILDSYHKEILIQAKNSFKWALITSATGFFFFLTSVVFVIYKQPRNQALIPLVSGAVIELIAAVNFYLYGQATKQLSSFHRKLDQTQRFLLANSICESLDGEAKQTARSELVKTVSTLME